MTSNHRLGHKLQTMLQVLAIACGIFIVSLIAHKAFVDVTALAAKHTQAEFWPALARYLLRNLAGGG